MINDRPESPARISLADARPIVRIDLPRIAQNVVAIRRQTHAAIMAVVKADAYGLGARQIATAIAPLVDGFCVFSLDEAIAADLWAIGRKPIIALGPAEPHRLGEYLMHHVRPAVCDAQSAAMLREAGPILSVDTGMQRFTCEPEQIDAVLKAGDIHEAMTHATRPRQVKELQNLLAGRQLRLHAAATALLENPEAQLAAVRPGLALYRGAVRVSAKLLEVHNTRGPAGYSGFQAARHGVILAGYSNGLRKGPCLVNGQRRRILEVGMQTAFVEIGEEDRLGDEVVLLGHGLSEQDVAAEWNCSAHEALLQLARCGKRLYVND